MLDIYDLEIGDIVFVKKHWYCSVKSITFLIRNRVAITFEHCKLDLGKDFFIVCSLRKKFVLFE